MTDKGKINRKNINKKRVYYVNRSGKIIDCTPHERTIYKKQLKNREVLIWDSAKQGTFRGNLKRTFNF